MKRARADKRAGKSASTQAGEFVREQMRRIGRGERGAKTPSQAIAIGLSMARRFGVKLGASKGASAATKRKAEQELRAARRRMRRVSRQRAGAIRDVLERQSRSAASRRSLSRQVKTVAAKRSQKGRSQAAKKAARTRAKKR
jgi:hypothetical protein